MSDSADLVARIRAGDQEAFRVLVHSHQRRIWAVCFRITGNRHDAEDAVQEALTAAWHHIGNFRGEAEVGTWLYRIAANAAIGVTRRRKRSVSVDFAEDGWDDDAGPGHLATPASDLDLEQRVVDVQAVRAAIAKLPDAFRQAIVLRELCDYTYEQIAEAQGINLQTVKSRISRGRALLRAELTS